MLADSSGRILLMRRTRVLRLTPAPDLGGTRVYVLFVKGLDRRPNMRNRIIPGHRGYVKLKNFMPAL